MYDIRLVGRTPPDFSSTQKSESRLSCPHRDSMNRVTGVEMRRDVRLKPNPPMAIEMLVALHACEFSVNDGSSLW